MLVLSIRAADWDHIFGALPLFEQATSLGYLLLARTMSDLSGDLYISTMRVLAVLASISCGLVFFAVVRQARPAVEAVVAAGVLMLSPVVVFQSIELKAYIFEMLATACIMAVALNSFEKHARIKSLTIFFAVSIVSLIFSNTAIFILAGFGAALFFLALADNDGLKSRLPMIFATGLAIVISWLVVYLLYTREAAAFQLEAYAHDFAQGRLPLIPLSREDLRVWTQMAGLLQSPYFLGYNEAIRLTFVILAGIGGATALFSASRPTRFLALGGTLSVVALIAAAILGVFTPHSERHILFIAPVTAFFAVHGAWRLLVLVTSPLSPRWRAQTARTAFIVLGFTYAVSGAFDGRRDDREVISPLLADVRVAKAWPQETWVYYAAQPAVDVLAYPSKPAYLGRVSHVSSRTAWLTDVRRNFDDYLARFRREIAGRSRLYILSTHADPAERSALLAEARRAIGPCRLVRQAEGNRSPSHLFLCQRPLAGAAAS